MQTNNKNNLIAKEDVKNKGEEYFFSGGQEYLPQTIRADSQEEAEKLWEQSRKKVEKPLKENN
jgi:hypothetical protein